MTPKEWFEMTIGKSYDSDNFPAYWKWQCWDYIDFFKKYNKLNKFSTYCALTGYAGDIWKLRWSNGAKEYFEFIAPQNIKSGDWIFWEKHVAFLYVENGIYWEVGQNQIQPRNTVTKMRLNRNGILGGFRWKGWTTPATKGVAECYSAKKSGVYTATANVNIRAGGSTNFPSMGIIKTGETFVCYGYYHMENNTPWLYGTATVNGKKIVGFVCSDYLKIKE